MIQISHLAGRREGIFPFLLFLEKVAFPKVILRCDLEDASYKCPQIDEISIMRNIYNECKKHSFGFFIYNVSSGPELSSTFSGRHMENITVNDAC